MNFSMEKSNIIVDCFFGVNLIVFVALYFSNSNPFWLALGISFTIILVIFFIIQNVNWDNVNIGEVQTNIIDVEKISSEQTSEKEETDRSIEEISKSLNELIDKTEKYDEFENIKSNFEIVLKDIQNKIEDDIQIIDKTTILDEIKSEIISEIKNQVLNQVFEIENKLESNNNNISEVNRIFKEKIGGFEEKLIELNEIKSSIPKIEENIEKKLISLRNEFTNSIKEVLSDFVKIILPPPKTKPEPRPEPKPKPKPQPEPKPKPQPEPKPKPQSEPKPKPQSEPKPKPQSEPKPETGDFLYINGRKIEIILVDIFKEKYNINNNNYKIQKNIRAVNPEDFKLQTKRITKLFKNREILIIKAKDSEYYYLYYRTSS